MSYALNQSISKENEMLLKLSNINIALDILKRPGIRKHPEYTKLLEQYNTAVSNTFEDLSRGYDGK